MKKRIPPPIIINESEIENPYVTLKNLVEKNNYSNEELGNICLDLGKKSKVIHIILSLKRWKDYIPIIKKITNEINNSEKIIRILENIIYEENMSKGKSCLLFKIFYDEDIIEEEEILTYKYQGHTLEKILEFINWLKEADTEDEEEVQFITTSEKNITNPIFSLSTNEKIITKNSTNGGVKIVNKTEEIKATDDTITIKETKTTVPMNTEIFETMLENVKQFVLTDTNERTIGAPNNGTKLLDSSDWQQRI